MRLGSLRLRNFRSCKDVTLTLDNYTCLVGPNGAGKSTILAALNILFRHNSGSATPVFSLTTEDFCNRDTTAPISITATFVDLSQVESDEFRRWSHQGRLVVTAQAEWADGQSQAQVKQYGSRMGIRAFLSWFAASAAGSKVPELKELYSTLRQTYSELPSVASKADMAEALHTYEEAHLHDCELLEMEMQFYGWPKGENPLRNFVQWVYIPAVKDAQSEQEEAKNTALGELLQRTIRAKVDFDTHIKELKESASQRYQELLTAQQTILASVSSDLENRLQSWSHPGAKLELSWSFDPERAVVIANPVAKASIGESDFIGEVSRLGHGLQRAFIVSLLQELATGGGSQSPKLILGFEEPELYQHPPQARHLATLLQQLSQQNTQVVATTHSPYFVSGRGFENIRMVRKSPQTKRSQVSGLTMDRLSEVIASALGERPGPPTGLMAAVEQILQPSQSELFFCGLPVLVEGLEDVAYLASYLQLTGRWDEFRRLGGHFVTAEGKTNLSRPLAMANELSIPSFVVFDGDRDQVKSGEPERNRRDNGCILRLCGMDAADPLSPTVVWGERVIMWPTQIGEAVRGDLGVELWTRVQAETEKTHGFMGVKRKSGLLIAAVLESLWEAGHRSALLEKASNALITYGRGLETSEGGFEKADSAPRVPA